MRVLWFWLKKKGNKYFYPKTTKMFLFQIYRNSNFKRDNVLLLENIQRKGSFKNNALRETSASTPKRKKQDTTKPSQGVQNSMNETIQNSQKKPPNVQEPSGSLDFMFSRTWSLSGVAGPPIKNCPPHQPNVPNREDTSQRAKPAPTATAEPTGAGAPPMGHTVYLDGASVMLLYNTCYLILLAALSVMSINETCDEQQESPSESLWTIQGQTSSVNSQAAGDWKGSPFYTDESIFGLINKTPGG